MDFLNGRLQLFLGPQENQAPDNLEQVIVDFLDAAEDSLLVAVQELDNPVLADALDRAARRKKPGTSTHLLVRFVTEGDYLKEQQPVVPPDAPSDLDPNRNEFVQLLRGAVDCKIDFNPKIFHHKFVIRDRGKAKAAVLTGSANFTNTDTHRNLNHVAIFHDDGVVAAYESEFDQLREGIFGERSLQLTTMDPLKLDVEGSEVQIAFSPDNNPELRIVNEILKAQHSVYLLMFTFASSTTIDDALLSRLQAGNFRVKGVLDSSQSAHNWSPHPALITAGAQLRKDALPNQGKLHHKLIVLDEQVVIGGSFNYTAPANRYNDENIFIVRNAGVAQYCIQEVERIYNDKAVDF
jgi:phosphatidylserine/phosphatidylglycerophosphate/cardiolipin synthase-like enzyme